MDKFYKMGQHAALVKLGMGGIMSQLGTAAKGAYKGLSPEATHAMRRMGTGAAVGAAGGAVADDFSLRGALGGAALGAGGGLGYSKLRTMAKQAPIRKELAASGKPMVSDGQQLSLLG